MSETVSIIIPIYNAEKVLKECLDSVIRQTYSDLRIILVDDGSTDRSGKICDEYAAADKRIEVIHKENGGLVDSRFVGIRLLTEDGYTVFSDSDDILPPNAVETLLSHAEKTHADMVRGGVRRFFGRHLFGKHIYFGKNSLTEPVLYTKEDIHAPELLAPSIGLGYVHFTDASLGGAMWGQIYRNTLLKKGLTLETPTRFFQEDVVFNMQLCLYAERIAVIPDTVYFYRTGGTTRYRQSDVDDALDIYEFKLRYIEKLKDDPLFQKAISEEPKHEYFKTNKWVKEYGYDAFFRSTVLSEILQELMGSAALCEKVYRKNPDACKKEIKRMCELPKAVAALNTPMLWEGAPAKQKFVKALREKDVDAAYETVRELNKKTGFVDSVKSLLRKI